MNHVLTDDKENNGLVVRFIDPAVLLELEDVAITLRSVANFLESVQKVLITSF